MKKYVKLVSVIVLAVLMCAMFCSCFDVDELREQHAVWGNDEQTVIKFNGAEYKLLPPCDELYIVPSDKWYVGYVTESDVPLLLIETYGRSMNIGKNAEMLVAGVWKDSYKCNRVYCRSDLYDAKVEAINNFQQDHYCVYDPSYDKETGETIHQYRLLTGDSISAINTALSGEGTVMDSFNHSGEGIYMCDKTLQFVGNADNGASMWVTYIGGKACVVVENFDTSSKLYNFVRYEIPQELYETVIADVKPYGDYENYDYDSDYYY